MQTIENFQDDFLKPLTIKKRHRHNCEWVDYEKYFSSVSQKHFELLLPQDKEAREIQMIRIWAEKKNDLKSEFLMKRVI